MSAEKEMRLFSQRLWVSVFSSFPLLRLSVFCPWKSLVQAQSPRQQVESIEKEHAISGVEVDSPCGPSAPCRARLEAVAAAHHRTVQELQERHARAIRELEEERDRALHEGRRAAARGDSGEPAS